VDVSDLVFIKSLYIIRFIVRYMYHKKHLSSSLCFNIFLIQSVFHTCSFQLEIYIICSESKVRRTCILNHELLLENAVYLSKPLKIL